MGVSRLVVVGFLLVLVASTGCIMGSDEPPPPTYVTPCNVIDEETKIKVPDELNWKNIQEPLSQVLLDDLVSPSAVRAKQTYRGQCRYGTKPGEVKEYYYCFGSYEAPDLDETGTITRYLLKKFTVGFEVEEHPGETWIDLNGKKHYEAPYYLLTVKRVDTTCIQR